VTVAVGIFTIPTYARLARATGLTVKEREFVEAARATGMGGFRIVLRHILPNCVAPLIVQTSLRMGSALLTASGLSFLGLGAQPPSPEWGAMLATGREYMRVAPHVVLFPGLAIVWVVLGFNLLGDGLRDVLDPRSRAWTT
jgi:ABC-type dipeptide/oligopeptide/nickel transport system permease subunit